VSHVQIREAQPQRQAPLNELGTVTLTGGRHMAKRKGRKGKR